MIIGTGVNDKTVANERMLSAEERVLDGCEIPRVTLGYDEALEIIVVASCNISWQSVDGDVDDGRKVQLTLAVG